eukprot:6609406-Alexandrium_andersonii.AAC.1
MPSCVAARLVIGQQMRQVDNTALEHQHPADCCSRLTSPLVLLNLHLDSPSRSPLLDVWTSPARLA